MSECASCYPSGSSWGRAESDPRGIKRGPSETRRVMSYDFVDEMMEKSRLGELRSPVSETLEMHLVQFGRGEAVYEMAAREDLGNPLGVIQGGVATALA